MSGTRLQAEFGRKSKLLPGTIGPHNQLALLTHSQSLLRGLD